jgi:hypothetical protein
MCRRHGLVAPNYFRQIGKPKARLSHLEVSLTLRIRLSAFGAPDIDGGFRFVFGRRSHVRFSPEKIDRP